MVILADQNAKPMNIHLVHLPVDPVNILFQVFESHICAVLDRMPVNAFLPQWTIYAQRG